MAGLRMTFLGGDSTPEQLLPAVVGNHRQWLLYSARLKGGEVRRENGATIRYCPSARHAAPWLA